MTLDEWIVSDNTGLSSKTMWAALKRVDSTCYNDVPLDPDDFRRCYEFYLNCHLTPEDLKIIANRFPIWKPYVESWDKMVEMYNRESPTGSAPDLYEFMKELREEALICDGWTKTGKHSWHKDVPQDDHENNPEKSAD